MAENIRGRDLDRTDGLASRVSRWILPGVLAVWAGLILASLGQDLLRPAADARIWILDVDAERSIYTWYSQLLLAGAAALLFLTGLNLLKNRPIVAVQWLVLAAGFLLLSMEEAVGLHGKLSEWLGGRFELGGYFQFAWVIPAIIICALLFVASVPFLRSLPIKTSLMLMLSGAVYLSGAVGVEMIGANEAFEAGGEVDSFSYRLAANIEEAMEGLGVILLMWTVLRYRDHAAFRTHAEPAFQQL